MPRCLDDNLSYALSSQCTHKHYNVHQAGQEATSSYKPAENILENISEVGFTCMCLNARSIINKKSELNIMLEDDDHHITGITETLTDNDDRHIRC